MATSSRERVGVAPQPDLGVLPELVEFLGRQVPPLGALAGLDLRDHAHAHLGLEELGVEKLDGSDHRDVVVLVGPGPGYVPGLAVAAK